MSNKRNWKIVYSNYSGLEKKAIELVSAEVGAIVLRDFNTYTLHVLPCETVQNCIIDRNIIAIGVYDDNEFIQKHLKKEEIPADGYVVKVMDNPENPDLKLVLITSLKPANVFYGAVDFVDDYFTFARPKRSSLVFRDEIFDGKIPDYFKASAPKIKKRTIFTWGQPINDYRNYIETIARMKFNQLIIWNDFVPINANDIVDYAHEYGIQLIWGYAWGWSRNCGNIDLENLDKLTDEVIEQYEVDYANTGADGIYFQSFTELHNDYIGNKLIAEVVTDFVNKTSAKLLEKHPNLYIQFGLHAWPAENHLEYIAKTDSRVDIVWEDCGAYPFNYQPNIEKNEDYEKALNLTKKIIHLRDAKVGLLYKGMMVLDWDGDRFVHQAGPYIMGMNTKKLIEHDRNMLNPIWRNYEAEWIKNGKYAYDMTKFIVDSGKTDITLGIAGQLANGSWFPAALCAQMFWDCDEPYENLLNRVLKRESVEMV